MQSLPAEINPFALMIDPQAVLARIGCSDRLEGLQRHICRPLDKVALEVAPDGDSPADDSPQPLAGDQLPDFGSASN